MGNLHPFTLLLLPFALGVTQINSPVDLKHCTENVQEIYVDLSAFSDPLKSYSTFVSFEFIAILLFQILKNNSHVYLLLFIRNLCAKHTSLCLSVIIAILEM